MQIEKGLPQMKSKMDQALRQEGLHHYLWGDECSSSINTLFHFLPLYTPTMHYSGGLCLLCFHIKATAPGPARSHEQCLRVNEA